MSDLKEPSAEPSAGVPGGARLPKLRWLICVLLFLGTTINYMDRQILSVLKPVLAHDLNWSETDYSHIVVWFQGAYAVGNVLAGRVIDLIGVRTGYGLAVLLWSLAAMAHAGVRGVFGFSAARVALGVAEGGNFPAAIGAVTDWFPQRERAFATGIFNFGSNFGAIVTPLLVPGIVWVMTKLHLVPVWRGAFIVIGALGLLWLVAWLVVYFPPQKHPWLSKRELEYIQSDQPVAPAKMTWLQILQYRATWAYVVGTLLTSPIWWFYLFWGPAFLNARFGLDLNHSAVPVATIYTIGGFGSVGAGWIAGAFLRRGWSVNAARKTALLICALCAVPVCTTPYVSSAWMATGLIGLAAAAHQGWSANFYTVASDTMPREAVGSIVGFGGAAGSVVAMGFALFVGDVLQRTHVYKAPFAIASVGYLIALLCVQILVPNIQRVKLKGSGSGFDVVIAPPNE